MAEFEKVAALDEVQPGDRKPIILGEVPALLVRVGDNYYAIEDVCTHDGQPLTYAPIAGTRLICPRHGALFEITTGKALRMPATEPIAVYDVEVREDGVYAKPND